MYRQYKLEIVDTPEGHRWELISRNGVTVAFGPLYDYPYQARASWRTAKHAMLRLGSNSLDKLGEWSPKENRTNGETDSAQA